MSTSNSNSNSNSQSASGSGSSSGSGSASSSSTLSIPQSAPAGTLSMTQPPQSSTSFFKLASNDPITFGWSFSGVLATPTSLTIQAVGANSFTYSITELPGTASSVVWDAWSYQQSHQATPLAQTTYTLEIFDERGLSASTEPGYLSPNTQVKFALYTPQPYTPLVSWQCGSICNAASPTAGVVNSTFVAVLATFFVVFLSGFGLLRNAFAHNHR